jgi:hypothetical protein
VSPTPSPVRRRRLWLAGSVLAIAGLSAWLVASGNDGSTPEAAGSRGEPGAVAPGPTPGAAPSSGPTEPPSPGSLEVVPVEQAASNPAIPLTATADFGTGMELRIVRVESVQGVARAMGEIAGPALRLTLRMSNGSDSAVSLDSAVVNVSSGAGHTPASTLSGPGSKAFHGEVAPDDSMTGAYVFGVPEGARDRLQVTVSYSSEAPVVVFTGAAG